MAEAIDLTELSSDSSIFCKVCSNAIRIQDKGKQFSCGVTNAKPMSDEEIDLDNFQLRLQESLRACLYQCMNICSQEEQIVPQEVSQDTSCIFVPSHEELDTAASVARVSDDGFASTDEQNPNVDDTSHACVIIGETLGMVSRYRL
jgi:hypothetical protein